MIYAAIYFAIPLFCVIAFDRFAIPPSCVLTIWFISYGSISSQIATDSDFDGVFGISFVILNVAAVAGTILLVQIDQFCIRNLSRIIKRQR